MCHIVHSLVFPHKYSFVHVCCALCTCTYDFFFPAPLLRYDQTRQFCLSVKLYENNEKIKYYNTYILYIYVCKHVYKCTSVQCTGQMVWFETVDDYSFNLIFQQWPNPLIWYRISIPFRPFTHSLVFNIYFRLCGVYRRTMVVESNPYSKHNLCLRTNCILYLIIIIGYI